MSKPARLAIVGVVLAAAVAAVLFSRRGGKEAPEASDDAIIELAQRTILDDANRDVMRRCVKPFDPPASADLLVALRTGDNEFQVSVVVVASLGTDAGVPLREDLRQCITTAYLDRKRMVRPTPTPVPAGREYEMDLHIDLTPTGHFSN